jgi:hypothetical protein
VRHYAFNYQRSHLVERLEGAGAVTSQATGESDMRN